MTKAPESASEEPTLLEAARDILKFAGHSRQRLRAGAVVDDVHLDRLRRAVETNPKGGDMIYDTLIQKAEEAERISRQPDSERDPGGRPDSVNEYGRTVAHGRAEAFREAAELVRDES